MAEGIEGADGYPTIIPNFRINSMLDLVRNCHFEVASNQVRDTGSGFIVEADLTRLKSYITAMRSHWTFMCGLPALDLPATKGKKQFTVPQLSVVGVDFTKPENIDVQYMLYMFEILHFELANAESARNGSAIHAYDKNRVLAILSDMDEYLTAYVEKMTPLDLPESTPEEVQGTSGYLGV